MCWESKEVVNEIESLIHDFFHFAPDHAPTVIVWLTLKIHRM